MTSPSEEPVVEKKNTLTGLLRAIAFAQQQANGEKEVRLKTIHSLVSAREALLPVFGADGNLVLRISKTIAAVINSLPCEFDPAVLIEEITQLAKTLEAANGTSRAPSLSSPSPFPKSNSVFIIHGHDENNWLKLDRMLRTEFNLEPIVILARAGQSLPTIQKFENDASRCAYAIAMFTPDDAVFNEKAGKCSQARPNVIFEAGWFIGRLGKDRVLLLVKNGTQLHSDFAGMNRIEFQDDINHKFLEIKRELEASQVIPS
ncbi:MAG: hypothetical protein B7Z37_06340 [Verrucomicrobia bacterium 12-59-8]|nr:MAG: hypothetical protein B7Z37_06340 [Verrucomicrobia bacterium 12-59-8]